MQFPESHNESSYCPCLLSDKARLRETNYDIRQTQKHTKTVRICLHTVKSDGSRRLEKMRTGNKETPSVRVICRAVWASKRDRRGRDTFARKS